jgi:hypothetical protein
VVSDEWLQPRITGTAVVEKPEEEDEHDHHGHHHHH